MITKGNKEILRLAVPNILANLSQPLLSAVDTALMGDLSVIHIGAVGLASMVFNIIFWNFGFLRMGTTGMTAQAYGRSDLESQLKVLLRAITLGLFISLVLLFTKELCWNFGVFTLDIQEEQSKLAASYFFIRIFAAPATLILYVLNGWFLGMQNARIPLLITVAVNVVNILLSFYLVKIRNLGIEGAALGTMFSQFLALLLAIVLWITYYFKRYKGGEFHVFDTSGITSFFSINRDLFLRTVLLTFSFAFFYRISSSLGDTILAGNVILLQLVGWMAFFVDGFAFAAESVVGKYLGIRDFKEMKRRIVQIFSWSALIALSFSLVYGVFLREITELFTTNLIVLDYVSRQYIWLILIPIAATPCYVFDGIFIGLTKVSYMRNSIFMASVVYMLSYFGLIHQGLAENMSLWISFLLFLFSRSAIQGFQYHGRLQAKGNL